MIDLKKPLKTLSLTTTELTLIIGLIRNSAATFQPWLAPHFEIASVGYLSYKYLKDKVEELKAKKQASRSLTGVLSAVYEDIEKREKSKYKLNLLKDGNSEEKDLEMKV